MITQANSDTNERERIEQSEIARIAAGLTPKMLSWLDFVANALSPNHVSRRGRGRVPFMCARRGLTDWFDDGLFQGEVLTPLGQSVRALLEQEQS